MLLGPYKQGSNEYGQPLFPAAIYYLLWCFLNWVFFVLEMKTIKKITPTPGLSQRSLRPPGSHSMQSRLCWWTVCCDPAWATSSPGSPSPSSKQRTGGAMEKVRQCVYSSGLCQVGRFSGEGTILANGFEFILWQEVISMTCYCTYHWP